jgi:glycine hydroxymethyltransferase
MAVALHEAATESFRAYAHQIVRNARTLAEELLARGYDLVSGGTDNHLLLVDLTRKELPGKQAARALDRAGVVVNYNTIPFDPRKPFDPSGIRLGTPAVTSRGMKEAEMRHVARLLDEGIEAARRSDDDRLDRLAAEVRDLTRAFPAPGIVV